MEAEGRRDIKEPARIHAVFEREFVRLPLVSVVVTCCNYGRFIGDCLRSIVNQTSQPIECTIVDDCSTDSSGPMGEQTALRIAAIVRSLGDCLEFRRTEKSVSRSHQVQLLVMFSLIRTKRFLLPARTALRMM